MRKQNLASRVYESPRFEVTKLSDALQLSAQDDFSIGGNDASQWGSNAANDQSQQPSLPGGFGPIVTPL